MATKAWKKFPYPDKQFSYAGAALKKHWERLHRGDCEPFPEDTTALDAWRAYHAGDKLFVEADIVLPAQMPLKDSHDLSEVLTYFLESVPIVDRAFVHVDYTSYNAPTHIVKQAPPK